MAASMEDGLHASTWDEPIESAPEPIAVARAARLLHDRRASRAGHVCPLTMTHASVAALAASPERLAEWLPKIRSREYDPRFIPFWEKTAVTLGMGMTEKQGGTRRARQHHPRRAGSRRRIRADRPQMVHVGAHVRRLPGAGAGARAA